MSKCLIVGLDTSPRVALLSEVPGSEFMFRDRLYADAAPGDFTGFYDWLRTVSHDVIGVRFSPFREFEFILAALDTHSYVNVSPGRNVEIFFSENHDYCAELSGDQCFGDNKIMSTESHEYLLTFGVDESVTTCLEKWL